MDQATLVSPDIAVVNEVLTVLDDARIKQITALLAIFPEYGDWRVVLSSPSLDQTHQLKAYEKVVGILNGRFVYRLPPILILPTKDPFIRELRKIFGKAKDVTGMRLGGQTIGNRFVEKGYVYRIQQ
jgi:hypothetical protein